MVLSRLILTSNGLTSAALQQQFRSWLPADPKDATVWYIPTAPLRDGWSKGQVQSQMASLQRTFGLGRVEWIDVEYVKGDALREAVGKLGKVDVVYAEMGNTYNLAHHLGNSGGAELIKELVQHDAVYVGASAGAIMAGRTVQMAVSRPGARPQISRDFRNLATHAFGPLAGTALEELGRPDV